MKTLLLILLFQLDASGQPGPTQIAQQLFDDEKACLDAGAAAKASIPKEVLSIATCVPQSAFNPPAKAATPPGAVPAPANPQGGKR
jgi:hypothetical protein